MVLFHRKTDSGKWKNNKRKLDCKLKTPNNSPEQAPLRFSLAIQNVVLNKKKQTPTPTQLHSRQGEYSWPVLPAGFPVIRVVLLSYRYELHHAGYRDDYCLQTVDTGTKAGKNWKRASSAASEL